MIVPGLVSRGQLQLQSADPLVSPRIDPDYQAEKYLPGDSVRSAGEIQAFIRAQLDHIFCPAGTCRMGKDEVAVVDARLQAKGSQGLRIADASFMPFIFNTHM